MEKGEVVLNTVLLRFVFYIASCTSLLFNAGGVSVMSLNLSSNRAIFPTCVTGRESDLNCV
mgnify:FL=1